MAPAGGRGTLAGIRRDPRLSPGAGVPLPGGAREHRRAGPRAGRSRRRPSGGRRATGAEPLGPGCGAGLAHAHRRAATRRRSPALDGAARPRVGTHGAGRVRPGDSRHPGGEGGGSHGRRPSPGAPGQAPRGLAVGCFGGVGRPGGCSRAGHPVLRGARRRHGAVLRPPDPCAEASGLRLAEGSILTARAVLAAMLGRADEARASAARARPLLEDLGGVLSITCVGSRIGLMEEILGDHERALETMRAPVLALDRLGEKSFFSTLASQFARVLALTGRLDEAEEFAQKGRDASPMDDWASQITWREALALVEAQRGNLEEAERLAREAVALTEAVDYLPQMADAWSDLGFVLRLTRRKGEAAEALRQSLSLREAKGDVVRAARVRQELAALA